MTFKIFEQFTQLDYGISEKKDHSMKFRTKPKLAEYLRLHGIRAKNLVIPIQSHSNRAVLIKQADASSLVKADSLVTGLFGTYLAITVADCFPVYFFNPAKKIIGLAHCGWRGTVNNLATQTLTTMGPRADDVYVGIGPGILSCHFEIQKDTLKQFLPFPKAVFRKSGRIFVDLPLILKTELIKAGVNKTRIEVSKECTFDSEQKYYSYRRDKPKAVEAMAAYIGLKYSW